MEAGTDTEERERGIDRLVYDLYGLTAEESGSGRAGAGGSCLNPPEDELQDLLARLISKAHELGTRGIFRGEPECFARVSSGLFRQLYEIDDRRFSIGSAQQRRVELARPYAPHLSDDDIVTRLQHLGGKTNLIDFTRDLNIALFFASYYSRDKDGRVILMEEPLVRREQRDVLAPYKLLTRGNPANMTDVQKSVWVEPENGYIDKEAVTIVEIPSALKPGILSHLGVVYGIEASTVYNDLSGFIRDQERLRDPEAEWRAGVRAYEAGHYERALDFFAQCEQLVGEPGTKMEYLRAMSYGNLDRREEALAAMESFRSRSPDDHRAFPEEMESAYAERQRGGEAERRRRPDQDAVTPATGVFPGFRIRLVGDAGTPGGTRIRIAHETGSSAKALYEKETFVTFRERTPEAGEAWLLSLSRSDYQGVDSQPVRWPVRKTLVLKAIDGAAPDIKVEIESLEYTYEPGTVGPLVAYPARSDGDSGSAA